MSRDIYKLTDDLSLEIQRIFDATENAVKMQIDKALIVGIDKATNKKQYINSQSANDKNFKSELNGIAEESTTIINNVITNISNYMAVDQEPLRDTLNRGTKLLISSGIKKKDSTLKRVLKLGDFNTKGKYQDNLSDSLITLLTSSKEIQSALPVTYTNGRIVPYKSYMEMAFRTGVQQEVGNKQIQIGSQNNVCFYAVNEFADCADDHAPYQGKIYYDERFESFPIQDEIKSKVRAHIKSKNMMSIQEVRDGGPYLTTRPNCRHRMLPLTIGQVLNLTLSEIKDKFSLSYGSYNDENYKDLKEQRSLERNIRKQKLNYDRTMSIAEKITYSDENKQKVILKAQVYRRNVLIYQKKQRELMKRNPFLQRDYRRESANTIVGDIGISANFNVQGNYINPSWYVKTIAPVKPMVASVSNMTVDDIISDFESFKIKFPQVPYGSSHETMYSEYLRKKYLDELTNKYFLSDSEIPQEVKDHYNIPKEDQLIETQEGIVFGKNILADEVKRHTTENKFIDHFKYNISSNFSGLVKTQKYNNKPILAKPFDFYNAYQNSDFILTRGYNNTIRNSVDSDFMRNEFEQGEFFVDNIGGAVYGRGMYFAIAMKETSQDKYDVKEFGRDKINVNDDITRSLRTANLYANIEDSPSTAKIDIAVLRPDAKIGTKEQIKKEALDLLSDTYLKDSRLVYNKVQRFSKEYSTGLNKVSDLLLNAEVDLTQKGEVEKVSKYNALFSRGSSWLSNPDTLKIEVEIEDSINRKLDPRREKPQSRVDIVRPTKRFLDLKSGINLVDDGVLATMLGYDGIVASNGEYFILLNRSKLVVYDDKGKASNVKVDYDKYNGESLDLFVKDLVGIEDEEILKEDKMIIIGEEE